MSETMRTAAVRRTVEYNAAVFRRFEDSVRRRGWVAATEELGIGHGSLKNTLVHVLNVREAWLVAIPQKHWAIFDEADRRPDEVRSWTALRAYRERVDGRVAEWLSTLTERSLDARVHAPWMPGRYTAEDGVHQATLEQAHHLGEIIGAYWQANRTPPSMTWIDVNRSAKRPARR
jgi:uncharacterized damage-inducible protein DinB